MFYCDKCAEKNRWPNYYGLPMSRGECEVCGKVAGCYDVPAYTLPRATAEEQR